MASVASMSYFRCVDTYQGLIVGAATERGGDNITTNLWPSPTLHFDDEFVAFAADDVDDPWAVLDPQMPSNIVALPLRVEGDESGSKIMIVPYMKERIQVRVMMNRLSNQRESMI